MKQKNKRLAPWTLEKLQITSGTNVIPTATVMLKQAGGVPVYDTATGNGPVNAACVAICRIIGIDAVMASFNVVASERGSESSAEAKVVVAIGALEYEGVANHDTDIILTGARAFLDGVNKYITSLRAECPNGSREMKEMGKKFA